MSRPIILVAHLSSPELAAAIATATDPVQRRRLRAIALLQSGHLAKEVAQELGRSRVWVSTALRLYNAGGAEALVDGRRANSGRPRKLTDEEVAALERALKQPPPQGGRWSGAKVGRWIKKELGKSLNKDAGVAYLRRLGYTRHPRASSTAPAQPPSNEETSPLEAPFAGCPPAKATGLPFAQTPYPSDLTDAQWAVLAALLPASTGPTDPRRVVNAVLYILRTGAPWAYLPRDFPPVSTVKTVFYGWVESGVWETIVAELRERWRLSVGRESCPSLGLIDSQSVKTSEKGGLADMTAARKSEVESGISL